MTKLSSRFLLGLILLGAACDSGAKQAAQARRAVQATQTELDHRTATLASELAQKAVQDQENKRDEEARQVTAARDRLRQSVVSDPGSYFEVGKLQMIDKGAFRHLASLSLTNNSTFLVTNLHGTVDFHDELDRPGSNSDVIASVPVELTGSIAPGASMVFSEQQHTLSGASIQLTAPPHDVDFKVTGVSSLE